eukprot:5972195-Pyramimonas_sp.AAC.1
MAIGSERARQQHIVIFFGLGCWVLGGLRGGLGGLMERFWGLLEHVRSRLGAFWAILSRCWGHFGLSEALLEPSWANKYPLPPRGAPRP